MASHCSACANTGQIKRMDTDTGMWEVEVCHCVKADPNKYLWPKMREWMESELARTMTVPRQYFYETTPFPAEDQLAKIKSRKRLAAEAEARIMGTDNLAPSRADDGPVILGIDWATDDQPQPEQSTMNLSTAIFLVSDAVRAIRVQYDPNDPGAKDYLFKTLDPTIEKDDLVVIPTSTRAGFTVCKVVEVDVQPDFDSSIQYKWAVKFDKAGFDAVVDQEKVILDRVHKAEQNRKRAELKASLKMDEISLSDVPLLVAPSDTSAS